MTRNKYYNIAAVALLVIGCDPKDAQSEGNTTESSNDGSFSPESDSGDASTIGRTAEEEFATACDLGPGWLADDALRQSCSSWLQAHCASRDIGDCSIEFTTSDDHTLSCIMVMVSTYDAGMCMPDEHAACVAGMHTGLINLCRKCGDQEVNTQRRSLEEGAFELMTVTDGDCGVSVFMDDVESCLSLSDDPVCHCSCQAE